MTTPPDRGAPPLPGIVLRPGQQGIQAHLQMSDCLVFQAADEWAKEDRLQASEKAWGAFSDIVKAMAIQRGWPHHYHDVLDYIGQQLAHELGRQDLLGTVALARDLHRNFYDHYMGVAQLGYAIGDVEAFVRDMKGLLQSGPQHFVVQDAAAQLRLRMLLQHEPEYAIPLGSYSNVGFSGNHDDPDPGAFPVQSLPIVSQRAG
jgi:hypothetical protein